jgi:hypothetical protein
VGSFHMRFSESRSEYGFTAHVRNVHATSCEESARFETDAWMKAMFTGTKVT